ncbi:MAG: hypothetical protein KAJ05_01545, partial [Candidatus Latescibacteria bacterium]|nr:hypothetical protein [Candidatus Latescibacterota bacterium]
VDEDNRASGFCQGIFSILPRMDFEKRGVQNSQGETAYSRFPFLFWLIRPVATQTIGTDS